MDKYELNLKIEEIKRLASIKSYKEASQMAKSMSWHKVKDWSALAAAISVHEAVGDYEEARDMAILAYNRNLGGRKLVYKLTELLIKLEQLEDAQGLYDEYEKMSQHDVNRYILQYDLRKAQGASNNELVEILEDYKAKEIDEKYMYELAKLYSKTGRTNECIEACDELALLFQDGTYVEKAMLLKSKVGGELTKHQTKQLEQAKNKDSKISRDLLFEQQSELTRIQHDDIDEVLEEDEKKSRGLLGLFSKPASKPSPKEDIDVYENEQDSEAVKEKSQKKNPFTDNKIEKENVKAKDDTANSNVTYNLREFVLAKVRESEEKRMKEQQPEELETFELPEKEEKSKVINFASQADTNKADKYINNETTSTINEDINHFDEMSDSSAVNDSYKINRVDNVNDFDKNNKQEQIKAQESPQAAIEVESDSLQSQEDEKSTVKKDTGEGEIPESLMKLISNARKSIDTSYNEMNKEYEQERIKKEREKQEQLMREREDKMVIEEVKMPDDNIYDTQNLQETIAQTLAEFLDDDIEKLRPDIRPPENESDDNLEKTSDNEQIEGQMNLADWVESVREQKYGQQSTREFSKQELMRMLEEKDEKSAAYEMLMKKQKQENQNSTGVEFDDAKKKEYMQMIVDSVKTDLAFRTGKATRSLEEEIIRLLHSPHIQENIKESIKQIERNGTIEKPADSNIAKSSEKKPKKTNNDTDKISEEEISEVLLHTIQMQVVSDEVLREYVTKELEKQSQHDANKSFSKGEEITDSSEQQESDFNENHFDKQQVDEGISNKKFPTEELLNEQYSEQYTLEEQFLEERGSQEQLSDEPYLEEQFTQRDFSSEAFSSESRKIRRQPFVESIDEDEEGAVEENLKLEGELAKIFRKYREMPGIESQLAAYFASIDDEMNMIDSSVGNILITGNSSSDKTDLARNIVRALNYLYPEVPKKIAKTTGDSINHRGIAKAMSKLRGTVLIVEGAGSIQPKRIEELMDCLEQNTGRMIVIFEDSDAQMNVLLNFNPDLIHMFNHRIVLKQYTVNELVEMARKFARKRQYEVDDDALLALYLKINELHSMTDNIKLDDIKEIINKAIAHSEKRAARRFFGGVKKKRGEQGDIFFLSEADFKD
ncbi:MAG: hypothetical protein HFJ03_10815 [Lachnospira sp.]|nr:hypothetical protein [Lachnospira sp.]